MVHQHVDRYAANSWLSGIIHFPSSEHGGKTARKERFADHEDHRGPGQSLQPRSGTIPCQALNGQLPFQTADKQI